jgi:hypothetical protein
VKVKDLRFEVRDLKQPDGGVDKLYYAATEMGKFTVLDRLTGFNNSKRDIETGYLDKDNNFWLAAVIFDIRNFPDLTLEEAVDLIKCKANICRESHL